MTHTRLIATISAVDNETSRAHLDGNDVCVIRLLIYRIALHVRLLFAGPKESTT